MKSTSEVWQIGGRSVKVSNLDKIVWPEDDLTKRDMLRYYEAIASVMLPYLKDQPVTLHSFPNDIHGFSYYRRHLPNTAPAWLRSMDSWLLAMVVLVIASVSHLLKGLDYEEATIAAGLAVWLWFLRARFHARSDLPSVQQGLRALVAALLFTLAYSTIGFYLLDRHFSVQLSFGAALEQTVGHVHPVL